MNNNTQLQIASQEVFDANILAFEKVKQVAEYLAASDTFTKGFEQRDKGGVILIDEATNKPKINTADIAIALMAGHALGLNIAESIIIGSKLNQQTYLSILKGRELGIDVATAMEKIHTIPTSRGLVSYTGVEVISAKLMQGGIKVEFIKQSAPFYKYTHLVTGEEMELDSILDDYDNLKPEFYVYTKGVTTAEVAEEKKKLGITMLIKKHIGYYSKVRMTRTMKNGVVNIISKRFSTIDAERAELLSTYDAQGNALTKGKDNWNKAYPQMLDNRCITIAGRIIGADLINGIYSDDEITEIIDVTKQQTDENS